MKQLKKKILKIWKKITDSFPFSLLLIPILAWVLGKIFVYKYNTYGLTQEWYLDLYKWNIITVKKKSGKLICFLIFGCGFYTLGEFTRTFLFWRELSNDELEKLER